MQIQELRIGNWVQSPLGEIMKVCQLGHFRHPDFISAQNENGFGQNDFEGIPLTPELLAKAGFGSNNCITITEDLFLGFELGEVFIQLEKEDTEDNYYICERIILTDKYLHQLQNIYYALTGKELEINL